MGLRFRKRIKIMPGVRINIGASKSGISSSATVGVRGVNVNLSKRGTSGTVGVPGTGVSYYEKLSTGTGWIKWVIGIVIAGALLLLTSTVFAHGGGLDSKGCHSQRSNGTYHCHRSHTGSPASTLKCFRDAATGRTYVMKKGQRVFRACTVQ